ncbi:MAG: hypothetical protein AAFV54_15450 [Pseudomonadota bacterium]
MSEPTISRCKSLLGQAQKDLQYAADNIDMRIQDAAEIATLALGKTEPDRTHLEALEKILKVLNA